MPLYWIRLLTLLGFLLAAAVHASSPSKEWYFWTDDGVRHFARDLGTPGAPAVVVLHGGFGAEHGYLLDAIEPVAGSFHFVLYDQRGSLRSPASRESITFARMVDDLEQLRTELGLERMTLLGHSMGTALAYAYLERHPSRVERLVLVGPVFPFAPGGEPGPGLYRELGLQIEDDAFLALEQRRYAAFGEQASKRAAAQREIEGLTGEDKTGRGRTDRWRIDFASANIHHIERWRDMRGGQAYYAPDVSKALFENAGGHDAFFTQWDGFHPALRNFPGPITFIVGEQDFIDPGLQLWPSLVERLPGARLEAVQAAGHNLWIDQPEQFRSLLQEALQADSAVDR